jgi:hypothetical protein
MPDDCIRAYRVVGPTNRSPIALSPALIAVDSAVTAGMSPKLAGRGRAPRGGAKPHSSRVILHELAHDDRVGDRGLDLRAVADDAGVEHEVLDILLGELRHSINVEVTERGSEGLPPAQDRDPGQTGLEPLEAHFLEEGPISPKLDSPFLVVIAAILLVADTPRATDQPVLPEQDGAPRLAHPRWPMPSWSSNQTLVGMPLPPL